MNTSINSITTELNLYTTNLHLANTNMTDVLDKIITINNSNLDLDYINNLLQTLGEKLVNGFVVNGDKNITNIITNSPNITVAHSKSIILDSNFILSLKNMNDNTLKKI